MLTYLKYLCVFAVTFMPVVVFSQSGPGGVSNDGDPVKNCRLWLDAGDLASPTQSDGSEVTLWVDKSISEELDEAVWNTDFDEIFTAPLFRSNPAYSINGHPVVSFEDGGMLLMGLAANSNLNSDLVADGNQSATAKRTVFVAFRTGNDIASRQYLWEQGGGWKGLGIYIYNSNLYISAYDIKGGGNWPKFGFTYKKAPIQPNTTYIVSLILDAPTTNNLDTDVINNTSFKGTINGGSFGVLEQGASNSSIAGGGFGVGRIGHQGDPIGIGGVNSMTADESTIYDYLNQDCLGFTPCTNGIIKPPDPGLTGEFLFKGRIAEICYYAYNLNDAERIIVENYLAAKYFANVVTNDKYVYQTNYGNDVIGIGAESNGDDHNFSKGDNLFEISVDNMNIAFKYDAQSHYLLTGHNGNPMQWTNQNTPDTATVQRLRRTWRFDRDGDSPTPFGGDQNVDIKFDAADLPALPSSNHKLCVLIDNSNGPLPNFSPTSQLIEIPELGNTGVYESSYSIPDGAYFTIAAVRPTIQFRQNTAYTLENDNASTPTVASVDVELNYSPLSAIINTVVIFTPGTATNPGDYTTSGNTITITPPNKIGTISFDVINEDVVDPYPVLDFLIVLDQSSTTSGYFIGKRDTLIYKIYDDDPDPKATFVTATNDTITEAGNGGGGLAQIDVRINGTTTSFQDRTVRVINDVSNQTAAYGVDYTLPNAEGWGTLPLPDGRRYKDISIFYGTNQTAALFFNVFTDNFDENNESINFILEPTPTSDIGTDSNSIIEHTINLIDINPEPEVEFLATNSEGFEGVSQPQIIVTLSAPSAKQIEVPFAIIGGTATNDAYFPGGDYSADSLGTLIFPPGDTLSYLYYYPGTNGVTLAVYSDNTPEPDETINFEIRNPVTNAQLGSSLSHTYTIKDYQPFEWTGAAGVGKARDNTFWINLDNAVSGQSGNIPQLSPRPIDISQNTLVYQPSVVIGQNNQKVIDFSGSNSMLAVSGSSSGKSPFVNTAGFYDSKDIFFVVTVPAVSSSPQVIFEEGGENKGLNVYLKDNKIYFQAWNISDDDGAGGNLAPWGGNSSYAVSNTLSTSETYVVSCHYNKDATNPLRIYLDGELQGVYGSSVTTDPDYIGRLYVHGEKASIGGLYDKTRFDDGPKSDNLGYNFKGQIGEMIYYNERGDDMNTARIRIVHNYLSARFNIPLVSTEQVFNLTYADQTNTTAGYVNYNKDVAGIGIMEPGNVHGIAQGPAEMKVSGSSLSGSNKFILWGHNGVSFTNTWPFSYWNAALPGSVQERSGRVWRFSENFSETTDLQVEMNFSESDNAVLLTNNREQYLRLLVSSDADDWSGATVYSPATTQPDVNEGARVIFDNVNINDGDYVTLGNTSSINVAPLPIELLNFNARFEVDHVNLNWSTASETNNDRFEIERAGADLKWEKIDEVPGAGNSNTTIDYSEKDRNPLPGISYYRLKQVDFDGNYKYSDVVSVVNSSVSTKDEVVLFPNPSVNGTFTLQFSNPEKFDKANLSIFSASGQLVYETQLGSKTSLQQINYGNLPSGIYFVRITSAIFQTTNKLVIKR